MRTADTLSEPQNKIYQPRLNEPLKLNLGCGKSRMGGFINCDLEKSENTDLEFDLQERWPFRKETVSEIYCSHTLEHIQNHMKFFEEAYRVMKPFGTMVLRMPHGMSSTSMADVTHLRPWYPESFTCFQPGYDVCSRGNHYEYSPTRPYFWCVESFLVVTPTIYKAFKIPFIGKKLAKFMAEHLTNFIIEFWVVLQKTTHDSKLEGRDPRIVPCYFACWEHAIDGEVKNAGDLDKFRKFTV